MTSFLAIGAVNTIFYYGIYSILIYISLDYKAAVFVATIIGVIFSFKTFGKFVFNNKDASLIYKFLFVYFILYVCNITAIYLIDLELKNLYISGFVATLCCAVLSFVLNRWYVFKEKKG